MVWHVTKTAIERWLERLLHIHDTPERTAAAFALGVFIAFSPTLGLHTVIGLVLAFAFNLNRVAVLLGVYVNLPWFIGPFYASGTALGAWLTGATMSSLPSPSTSDGTALIGPDRRWSTCWVNVQPPRFSSQLVSPSS